MSTVTSETKAERLPMMPLSATAEPQENHLLSDAVCSYCESKNTVRRGWRKTGRGDVQLFKCKDCSKTFTPSAVKGKHYPLPVVLDSISLYNLGYSLERVCEILNKLKSQNSQPKAGQPLVENLKPETKNSKLKKQVKSLNFSLQPSSVANWAKQYEGLCRYARMRRFGIKMFPPEEVLGTATLAHRQLYRFRYHRAKTRLILEEDFKHSQFGPMREFLELVTAECPHQYFQEGLRASEAPIKFSKKEMIVRAKKNYATRLAAFVLGAGWQPRLRHDALQRFMIANDSVTVATEVPVYIRREDLAHMQTKLGFELYRPAADIARALSASPLEGDVQSTSGNVGSGAYQTMSVDELPQLITGHIDFLQIRNGLIHILDYKPHAAKEKPIEQLTLYALALSRLTGLRVFHFKCAWFDENDYFEFFPLHAVYKRKKGRRKRVYTKEGIYELNKKLEKIENLRPVVV